MDGLPFLPRQEIVRLNTIEALRCMDLSLNEIKKFWNMTAWANRSFFKAGGKKRG